MIFLPFLDRVLRIKIIDFFYPILIYYNKLMNAQHNYLSAHIHHIKFTLGTQTTQYHNIIKKNNPIIQKHTQ
jgi:hypothetical protein